MSRRDNLKGESKIMKTFEAILEVMKKQAVTKAALAKRLGISAAALGMRFNKKTITTEKVAEMARAMDYKLVLMPASSATPKNAVEVE